MQTTPYLARLREQQHPVAPYRGSLTRTDGGETAVLGPDWPPSQVLLYDTCWRASIAASGADARKWLNGMITANVRDLAAGRVVPAFQLDPKGHVLASLDVAATGEQSFRLLVDEEQRAGLLERLKKFVFISKVTLTDESEQLSSLLVRGPAWREAWRSAGLAPLAETTRGVQAFDLGTGLTPDDAGAAWAICSAPGGIAQAEVWASPPGLRALWERLQAHCLPAGSATLERDRILSAVPRYGVDVTEADLPQETGQLDCLDFTKGCYVGQEIVERIRARGAVHRHLATLALRAEAPAGSELRAGGKTIGKLTSLAPRGSGWLGLGYVRDPHQTPGTVVQAGTETGPIEGQVETVVEARPAPRDMAADGRQEGQEAAPPPAKPPAGAGGGHEATRAVQLGSLSRPGRR